MVLRMVPGKAERRKGGKAERRKGGKAERRKGGKADGAAVLGPHVSRAMSFCRCGKGKFMGSPLRVRLEWSPMGAKGVVFRLDRKGMASKESPHIFMSMSIPPTIFLGGSFIFRAD